jgi:pimeloyl-ACP methyl ester carboxylesterase
MKNTVIFVHGAWHASWCFNKVIHKFSELESKFGLNVIAKDLPGHGANKLNLKPSEITLKTYVDYVKDIIDKEISQESKVILVGFSMGGIVISQVAEDLGSDKISKLIYVSGFIPDKNGSLVEEEKKTEYPSVSLEMTVNESDFSISIKDKDAIKNLFYNCCSDEDVEWAISNFQDQPLRPFLDKVNLGNKFYEIPKVYVKCPQDNAIHLKDQERMIAENNCRVIEIDTDHSPFFSKSEELVELIRRESEEV